MVDVLFVQVTITPEVNSSPLNRAIMKQLVKLHGHTDLGMMLPVYDGRRALYTAGLLPFTLKDFTINLSDLDESMSITK